ncbi:MAG: 50S ribosomal protein L10 [Candidatus Magasanikbacteria bacterium CG_4_10_14_0_2_um_filter_37_12]|uniref:Large ribosomal subunit protein uL10 n=1 Tax=Candidatus Magasanikbacteria bacterium CG_4_10_14_0_2_um_filter_37_12 TaxID=1974637 RepID=A0A2M7V8B9_9BACT|nr:MAG: 50S ribosomal protein L10 [Candidatus Magasanikbacteria bacterium CG_4_10_14_0_2_um_filter_37_12]
MAKTKQSKEQAVQDLVFHLKDSKAAVFANFQGLKVSESEELRGICRDQNITYVASKKTLLQKALSELGLEVNTKVFEGSPAVIIGVTDEVAPAQIIAKFAKSHELVSIFGGMLEGKLIDDAKVKELSALPSKQELLAKVVGTLNAPISGFVNVLAGNLRGLVFVLSAIKDAKV